MYAEIMYPSNDITHHIEDAKEEKIYAGSMDAITKGTKDGLNIAVNVAAILISVLALVSIVDGALSLMKDDLSLQMILGWIFAPICWLLGVLRPVPARSRPCMLAPSACLLACMPVALLVSS